MPINAPNSKKAPTAEFKSPDDAQADDGPTNPDVETLTPDAAETRDRVAQDNAMKGAPIVQQDENFTFVRMPDGSVRAVRNDAIQNIGAFDSTVGNPEIPDEEMYVWLADGSVERVKQSKLPGSAGTNAVNGYYERDNKMHHIVAVYPVETEKS